MLRDISNVLISEERIRDRVHEIGAQIAADFEGSHDDESPLVLLPVMTGALVFSADLIRHLPFKLRLELVAISSYPGKSMASKGAKMASELPKDLEGKHVIIVDDILDSGHTIAVLKSLIAEQSPASIKVCVMLEKQRNDGPPIAKADYVGFAIPDEFVVGYGLDYDGYYRNHPEIVTLREDAL
ncbi:MAG: hypoxanthine phosphoribosyltransferase [Phycisphaerales bacterium JB061]